jgi:signal transduction histidine kinase
MADRMTSAIRTERELLANISHELRTPLQRIRLALDIAAEGGAETAGDSLTEISEDLVELEALVNDVLSTTRLSLQERGPTSAVPPLRHEPIEARGLLEKAASRFRGAHPARHLDARSTICSRTRTSTPTIRPLRCGSGHASRKTWWSSRWRTRASASRRTICGV